MHHPQLKAKIKELASYDLHSGDLGVELEIEGVHLPTAVPGWYVKTENSLRNAAQGGPGEALEYTTSGAYTLTALATALDHLYTRLTKEPTKVTLTHRASTHIHLNMQNYSVKTYFGFVMLFSIIEPLLVKLCGPERNGNLFCLPSYETGDLAMVASAQAQQLIDGVHLTNWRNRGKYACLNTDPLKSFGSVEVRCFPNTIEPGQVLQWATWLLNVRRTVDEWSGETYSGLFGFATENPNALAEKIFTGVSLYQAAYPHNVSDLIGIGAETGYEVYRATRKVFDFKAEEHKKPKTRLKKGAADLSWAPMAPDALVTFDQPEEDL